MTKSLRTFVLLALLALAMGVVMMRDASAASESYGYAPTRISEGIPVFYIVILEDGTIRPASATERDAIDVAIENGVLLEIDTRRNIATQ